MAPVEQTYTQDLTSRKNKWQEAQFWRLPSPHTPFGERKSISTPSLVELSPDYFRDKYQTTFVGRKGKSLIGKSSIMPLLTWMFPFRPVIYGSFKYGKLFRNSLDTVLIEIKDKNTVLSDNQSYQPPWNYFTQFFNNQTLAGTEVQKLVPSPINWDILPFLHHIVHCSN